MPGKSMSFHQKETEKKIELVARPARCFESMLAKASKILAKIFFFMTSFRPPTCISVLKRLRPATSRLSSWATKLKWASQKPSKITKPC